MRETTPPLVVQGCFFLDGKRSRRRNYIWCAPKGKKLARMGSATSPDVVAEVVALTPSFVVRDCYLAVFQISFNDDR